MSSVYLECGYNGCRGCADCLRSASVVRGLKLDAAITGLLAERDEARATARVLAHAYETDNRPLPSVVKKALAYPVTETPMEKVPWRCVECNRFRLTSDGSNYDAECMCGHVHNFEETP